MNPHTGTVRLIDRRTRLVELFGSAPLGSRGPTDQELLFDHLQAGLREYVAGPQSVGFCFRLTDGRRGSSWTKGLRVTHCSTSWPRGPDPSAPGAAVRAFGLAGGGVSGKEGLHDGASGPAHSLP